MKFYLLLIFYLSFGLIVARGNSLANKSIDKTFIEDHKDSLYVVVGKRQNLPDSLELSILAALQYYPQLKTTKIKFKSDKIKTTLNVRPTLWSLIFRKKDQRNYIIRINSDAQKSDISINRVPFNARIGLIGHELAHIEDYRSLNLWQMMKRAIGYLSANYRSKYEKHIDDMTVKAGLGWQLYDWCNYVQNQPDISTKYKTYKLQNYLGGISILEKINHLKLQADGSEL